MAHLSSKARNILFPPYVPVDPSCHRSCLFSGRRAALRFGPSGHRPPPRDLLLILILLVETTTPIF
uniref:Uncharacterized protein n=1 Tax=Oryza glumipatula TaxID=40148 RepID=A0A0E0B7S4_9ORYZ